MNLSKKEVEQFTGSLETKAQRRFFKKNKIPFVNQIDGNVTTTWEAINHTLISQVEATNEPNFEIMDSF